MVGHSQRIPKIRDQRELSILVNETAKSHLLKPEILRYTQDDIGVIRIMLLTHVTNQGGLKCLRIKI